MRTRKTKQIIASFTVRYTDGTLEGMDASVVLPTNWEDYQARVHTFDVFQHKLKLALEELEETRDFSSQKKT